MNLNLKKDIKFYFSKT